LLQKSKERRVTRGKEHAMKENEAQIKATKAVEKKTADPT
jgi:hypothetical protein